MNRTLNKYRKYLHSLPNVVAVWYGYGYANGKKLDSKCIVCGVTKKVPLAELKDDEVIPWALDDVATDVIETGELIAFENTARLRPAYPGYSIGHVDITAGTFGCVVINNDDNVYVLSNNHVLANSNKAEIGDDIIQPGDIDGGKYPKDAIGILYDYVPIVFSNTPSTCGISNFIVKVLNWLTKVLNSSTVFNTVSIDEENLVDCAIALVNSKDVTHSIKDIGVPIGVKDGVLGMKVKKSGRTTELTHGEITGINGSAKVSYGDAGTAMFVDQLIITSDDGDFSAGGDSGSLIVSEDNYGVGLLFAGGNGMTIGNRIEHVLNALKVKL